MLCRAVMLRVQSRQQYGTDAGPFNAYNSDLTAAPQPSAPGAVAQAQHKVWELCRLLTEREQGAGFSGIENHLFYLDNTRMVYGHAQKVASQLIQAVKAISWGVDAWCRR